MSKRVPIPIVLLGRALRLSCLRCGRGPAFAGWFEMPQRCSVCGYEFERESGYFIGSIYINYGVAALLALTVGMLLDALTALPLWAVIAVALLPAVVLPLWFFRYARMLWMVIDVSLDPVAATELRDEAEDRSTEEGR